MIAVFMRNVVFEKLRDTLFVLWFVLVSIKMTAFISLNVNMHLLTALALLPIAAIGHYAGLKAHQMILKNDKVFKRVMGGLLIIISVLGLVNV